MRPDNYSKMKYRCKDEAGRKVKHQRHNWSLNGNKRTQYKLFLESDHFKKLKAQVKRLNPDHEHKFTDEFFKKKVNYKSFRRFLPNCVKPVTRASCVDPIEAKCYDLSHDLQLFFNGLQSNTKPRAQEK